jgi:nucleoside-diphosphate-sugar epimerase
MYGCNKLYCEQLGRYYSRHYKQLAAGMTSRVDFRCLRFPGLISADTEPSGGTSDYAPEMLHAAARRAAYACFVRPDTRIPLMAMPDAIEALLRLANAPRARLSLTAYNTMAFNPSADEIRDAVMRAFPDATIGWSPDEKRQRIVDSWPAGVNDSAARYDWGFAPAFDFDKAFDDYLVPRIRERYRSERGS